MTAMQDMSLVGQIRAVVELLLRVHDADQPYPVSLFAQQPRERVHETDRAAELLDVVGDDEDVARVATCHGPVRRRRGRRLAWRRCRCRTRRTRRRTPGSG